jgi:hypothetical protein
MVNFLGVNFGLGWAAIYAIAARLSRDCAVGYYFATQQETIKRDAALAKDRFFNIALRFGRTTAQNTDCNVN